MKIEYLESGSPDCPLIRIFGNDQHGMCNLRAAVRELISGSKLTIDLHELPPFSAVGGCKLTLRLASPRNRKGVYQHAGTLHFEWALPVAEWETVAALIEPFAEPPEKRGYQWLDDGEIAILLSSYENGRW